MSDKLRALTEQASPGRWLAQRPTHNAKTRLTLESGHDIATFETLAPHRTKVHLPVKDYANAKLASLATHLLPLQEALREDCEHVEVHDRECCKLATAKARKALKDLEDAL